MHRNACVERVSRGRISWGIMSKATMPYKIL